MLEVGKVLKDKYEIKQLVGKGGMSAVYLAVDRETGKSLAVKDALRASDQTTEQSLAAEGRVLKGLSNPHLPQIYDIIETDESIILVMDFIEGSSMDRVVDQEHPQSPEVVIDWAIQICQVLDYLHNQTPPIIYRDLKPGNLMLQPDGNIMLIDFGTARTQKEDPSMQSDTINIGTAGFAAPEQYGGMGQSNAKTDIFCLGATMYNFVTGHSPSEPPKGVLPLKFWNPALENTPIQEIIRKATSMDPEGRYHSAMEMLEALEWAKHHPVRQRGLTGLLSSGLRKGGWQVQDKNLQKARPDFERQSIKNTSNIGETAHENHLGFQKVELKKPEEAQRDEFLPENESREMDDNIRKILIFIVLAVGVAAIGMVFVLFGMTKTAIPFIAAGFVLGVIILIMAFRA